ncbi:MAG: hypothetical protein ACO36I_15135 [Candidatus Latescibacterota bacterium]|jgi:hypothetical protein
MLWVQASVILGSFLYIILAIMNYIGVVAKVKPLMDRAKARSLKLEDAIATEIKLDAIVQEQVENEKIGLTEIKLAVAEIKQEMRAAQTREQAIKQEFFKRGLPMPS